MEPLARLREAPVDPRVRPRRPIRFDGQDPQGDQQRRDTELRQDDHQGDRREEDERAERRQQEPGRSGARTAAPAVLEDAGERLVARRRYDSSIVIDLMTTGSTGCSVVGSVATVAITSMTSSPAVTLPSRA